jgi:predicted glycogen debranching enzyme
MNIHLPQRICRDVQAALGREWLVTNGIGGFAAGTVAGALTRRYHGLLLAALEPPLGRRLLVAKLDETAIIGGQRHQLYTNVWRSGVEEPAGCRLLERFDLLLGVPTWTFALPGARLVKRIWMEPGHNITYVRYALAKTAVPVTLECRLLVNDRDYHQLVRGVGRTFQVQATDNEIEIRAPHAATPILVRCVGKKGVRFEWDVDYAWCRGFHLSVEAARGFDHSEDHLGIGCCRVQLEPGASVTFRVAAGSEAEPDVSRALERRQKHAQARLDAFAAQAGAPVGQTPVPVAQLVLAADQFIVARASRDEPDGHTILAGYPWFTDWGRDTMIALPGLTLVTGRPEIARQILRTWARYVDQGLIPNRFPDAGDQPEYNTADAALWYLWAIDQYVRATADVATLAELFPVMQDIIARYRWGTRHHIGVGDDGLVRASAPGVNLTWMDAKIGDRVVTPRMGKPVELSALWYDALCNMARLADLLGQPDAVYVRLATATQKSFGRFWNEGQRCCYDVLDGPHGSDASVRPNQILAVSLTHSPLSRDQQVSVVAACERHLLTWFGLRSLPPEDGRYRGRYAGGPVERDEAYHQGTAWTWLMGPFALAHYRVHRDAAHTRRLLQPVLGQLWTSGLGSLSEIADGDDPHAPNGCFAQAWSVAETLRVWRIMTGGCRACASSATA